MSLSDKITTVASLNGEDMSSIPVKYVKKSIRNIKELLHPIRSGMKVESWERIIKQINEEVGGRLA